MLLFGLVIDLWLMLGFGLFFIAMVVACTFDRRANVESPKWWTLGVAFVVFLVYEYRLGTDWHLILNGALWMSVLYYMIAGLVYSCVGFMLDLRRSQRKWREKWTEYKTRHMEIFYDRLKREKAEKAKKMVIESGDIDDDAEAELEYKKTVVKDFVGRYSDNLYLIVNIKAAENEVDIDVDINRTFLAECIGVWTIFWPFYLISVAVADLLTELFHGLADFLAARTQRIVKAMFKDVFKF